MSDAYSKLGVSATKEDVHRAIARLPPPLFAGAFCHLVSDFHDPDLVQAIHSDGAGTKANVAYIAFRESGDAHWFGSLAQDSVVMNMDDMLCVGAASDFLLANTIGRNAKLIPGGAIESIVEGYRRFAEKMTKLGVTITLAGGETADSGDTIRTLIVDSTMYTRLPRKNVIDFSRVTPGDVIVGFESGGRASYEEEVNSGIGSNGLTLARHVLLSADYAQQFPETYSPELQEGTVYQGTLHIDDTVPGTDMTVAKALLSPTRTYAPVVRQIFLSDRDVVHGIIHNTGGGLTKCLKFGRRLRFVKNDLFPLPPIFEAIQEIGGLETRTMLQTFNCGHRLEVYCSAQDADQMITIASQYGINARVIGEVRESKTNTNEVEVQAGSSTHIFTQG
jgi:phosphoribosylformylglycinamidine cyclo-ligase